MTLRTVFDILKVAATYAGTIIGAGFASGQELMQFFVVYGSLGLAGIIVAGCLFAWLGGHILELGNRLKATGYHQLLYYLCGPRVGLFLDIIIAIFLFSILTVMLAGAGTMCRDNFELPYNLGLAVMASIIILTTCHGVKGIASVNIILTPLLAMTTIVVSLYSLIYHGLNLDFSLIAAHETQRPAPHWLLASLLYVSYNLVMGATVLAPLGACITGKKARMLGSIAGGITLAALASLVTMVIMVHYPSVLEYEIPMLYIASIQHPFNLIAYACMFLTAMFTTASASLYGCSAKLHSTTGIRFGVCIFIITGLSLLCSQIGFANLIATIFPIFGYATLLFTLRLIYFTLCSK